MKLKYFLVFTNHGVVLKLLDKVSQEKRGRCAFSTFLNRTNRVFQHRSTMERTSLAFPVSSQGLESGEEMPRH